MLAAIAGGLILSDGPARSGGPVTIHLLAGPIHTDILIPLDPDTRAKFADFAGPELPIDHPGAEWLVVGWGAREFYTTTATWRDLSLRATWAALTGDAAVLRLAVAGSLTDDLASWPVDLETATYDRLRDAILSTAMRDATGRPIPVDHPGYSDLDVFFEAQGQFDLVRTCNTWVGVMLRQAGVPFGVWTPLPLSVRLAHSGLVD